MEGPSSPDEPAFRPLDEATDEQRFLERELARVRTTHRDAYNAELAAVMSLIIPGAGQLYLGQVLAAVGLFLPSILFFKFFVPWIFCAIVGALAAYASARSLNGKRSSF